MKHAEQIINHLNQALSLLKNQSGYDEETDALQELIELIISENERYDWDYLRASPTEQARELQEEYER